MAAAREQIVTWAIQHGAPTMLLVGWDPASGEWEQRSPVGEMLTYIANGAHVSVAARLAHLRHIGPLLQKGRDYAADAAEDRDFVPMEVRPFVDLIHAVDVREASLEVLIVGDIRRALREDPKLALQFLSRRFGDRWREQQSMYMPEDTDERDRQVSEALRDPNVALALAAAADAIDEHVSGG